MNWSKLFKRKPRRSKYRDTPFSLLLSNGPISLRFTRVSLVYLFDISRLCSMFVFFISIAIFCILAMNFSTCVQFGKKRLVWRCFSGLFLTTVPLGPFFLTFNGVCVCLWCTTRMESKFHIQFTDIIISSSSPFYQSQTAARILQ